MNATTTNTALSLAEATDLIAAVGHHTTVLVQGELGIGKSSILHNLAARFPNHHAAYFDMTTKDVGDFMIPTVTNGTAEFVPNAELGLHTGKPVLLMLDEIGKAGKACLNACLRLMLERTMGLHSLPEGSIVFATTNLAAEGLGDLMPPHARNRICVTTVRKPNADEWIAWAMQNNQPPALMAFANEFPQVFSSYTEYETPDANHYINDPRTQRAAFVTPRSLAAAGRLINSNLSEPVLFHALCGTIGAPAAADLMAVLRLDNELPSWGDILDNPTTARVPTNGAALAMIVFRAVARVDKANFDTWLVYMRRMSREAQALFARQIMSQSSSKLQVAATNRKFVELATELGYLFM
jgi:hypothetical protein